jgi:hypothetical protein
VTGVVRVVRAANPWIGAAVYLRCRVNPAESSGLGSRAVRQSGREVCGLVQAGSDRQHLEAATR